MATHSHTPTPPYALLSRLWLHEPDAGTIARAVKELDLPPADPIELASAYTDVFLLNVPPYGSAFTAPSGELNGPEAQTCAALFEAHGYTPPELSEVGAPDHLGLCLGFLAAEPEGLLPYLLEWAPVCCLAVEREPSAHPFYRALASTTRQHLLAMPGKPESPGAETLRRYAAQGDSRDLQSEIYDLQSVDEVGLRDIVRFFLAPARCGVFLSRSRLGQMGRGLGLRLPFGSRFDVAEILLASAGEADLVGEVIDALEAEVSVWAEAYQSWPEAYPAWRPFAARWLARTADAARMLAEMRETAAVTPV